MPRTVKIIILAIIVVVAATILVNPFNTKINSYNKFEVTNNPTEKLQQSLAQDKPIFMEFYASW